MTDWDAANTFATVGGPMPFEAHKQPNEGESRTGHFNAGAQKSTMAGVVRSRVADQSELTFPDLPGDD